MCEGVAFIDTSLSVKYNKTLKALPIVQKQNTPHFTMRLAATGLKIHASCCLPFSIMVPLLV